MSSFHSITKDREASKFLLKTLDMPDLNVGLALDLGCGSGSDSLELLRQGWQVTSIDKSEEGINFLKAQIEDDDSIEIKNTSFEDMKLLKNNYDLIYSRYALYFCQKTNWQSVWKEIKESLKSGGMISMHLFGINDGFKNSKRHGDMTFFSKDDIKETFKEFKIIFEHEDEHDAKSAVGQMKHWHVFTIVAQKV